MHIRDADARPTLDLGLLKETVGALREATDLVVQLSTGGAVTDPEADRLRALEAAPDAASCTMGTVNFGDGRVPQPLGVHRRAAHGDAGPRDRARSTRSSTTASSPTLQRLLDRHGPPYGGHVHCDLVMGVPGGMPGTAQALAAAVQALPAGATFSATGVGRTTIPVMLAALSAGGHLRVGMEDTLTYGPG